MPNLMWLFLIPFLFAAAAFLLSGISAQNIKRLAVAASLIPLVILLYGHSNWIGSHVEYAWLPALSIFFHLEIDFLSLLFLYLTAVIIPICLLAVRVDSIGSSHLFFGFVLLLQGLLMGFFMARDLVLFTFFWEAMLLPLYFIITLWGGPNRQKAALKFLIYMIAGSSLMVAAVLALYFGSMSVTGIGTFNLGILARLSARIPYADLIFAIFVLAFAVKTPLFPFHAWLPDAYYQAPTIGTILLSALLSKAGIYGFLRIGLGLFSPLMEVWGFWLLILSMIGVFYGGLAAWMQNDFKRLIAYSSFSHVNFILAGIFVWSRVAHSGAIVQAINHGVTITALFLVAGWLADRLGSTAIGPSKGLATYLPYLCWFTLFFVLSSVALPGTNNFIGELLILFGLFEENPWLAGVLGLTIILSVIYMLRWMQKVYFEEPSPVQRNWVDMKGKEIAIALSLAVLILWVGLYPEPFLQSVSGEVKAKEAFHTALLHN